MTRRLRTISSGCCAPISRKETLSPPASSGCWPPTKTRKIILMRRISGLSVFLVCALAVSGQQTVSELSRNKEQPTLRPVTVTVDGRSSLKVENTNGLPVQVALATLTNLTVTGRFYSVSGEVKYDRVEGD